MDIKLIFGISVLFSLASSAIVAALYVWPWLRKKDRVSALTLLVAPHMFLRFIGLSFLVPGVVSPLLSHSFAAPAAYGDFITGILAILATLALNRRASWATGAVWVFNLWGTADLFFAFYSAARAGLHPGMFGAAFYIPTAIVPPVLMTHFLIFGLLFSRRQGQRRDSRLREPLDVSSPV
jgi:hypothetical protein